MRLRRGPRRHPAGMAFVPPEEESGYDGPANLLVGGDALEVVVHLDGHLEPLDGRYHWYGRLESTPALLAAKRAGAASGELTVGRGTPAALRLAEVDPWGNVQVNGTGAPPYPLEAVEI